MRHHYPYSLLLLLSLCLSNYSLARPLTAAEAPTTNATKNKETYGSIPAVYFVLKHDDGNTVKFMTRQTGKPGSYVLHGIGNSTGVTLTEVTGADKKLRWRYDGPLGARQLLVKQANPDKTQLRGAILVDGNQTGTFVMAFVQIQRAAAKPSDDLIAQIKRVGGVISATDTPEGTTPTLKDAFPKAMPVIKTLAAQVKWPTKTLKYPDQYDPDQTRSVTFHKPEGYETDEATKGKGLISLAVVDGNYLVAIRASDPHPDPTIYIWAPEDYYSEPKQFRLQDVSEGTLGQWLRRMTVVPSTP